MEAPEKIYMPTELLSEDWTRHIEGEDIEYIRKDAFIKKVCQWLHGFMECSNLFEYEVSESEQKEVIKYFKKAMEE